MILDALATGPDLVAASMVVIALLGFLYTLARSGHQNVKDNVEALIRQRDEAREDLHACERRVRSLERAFDNLANEDDK